MDAFRSGQGEKIGCCFRSWGFYRRDLVNRHLPERLQFGDRVFPSTISGPFDVALCIPGTCAGSFDAIVASSRLREVPQWVLRGLSLHFIIFFFHPASGHWLSMVGCLLCERFFNDQVLEDLQRKLQPADGP
jgi:hypothetical protein